MAKKDPLTAIRREHFRAYCRERGWESADGDWKASHIGPAIGKAVTKASNLLRGTGSFGPTIAREIEDALGLPASYLDGIGSDEGFVDIKRTDMAVGAGPGSIPHWEEELGSLKFRRDFLRSVGVTEDRAVIVSVRGYSMDPTIKDGSTLLVNKANREPHKDLLFVFWRPDEGLVVKRIVQVDGEWLARSDNDDRAQYPDFPFRDDQYLLGRAVWMGVKL